MASHKNISVIGLGYVGLPLAILAASKGYDVTGIDTSEEKVNLINKGLSPFDDEKISKELKKFPIKATTDFSNVSASEIVIICVPTPVYKNKLPNYKPVILASESVAKHLKKGTLIILESTVNPGTCEEIVIPKIEKVSGLTCGKDFYLAHCPERINPGDTNWHVGNIPRVVGGFDKKSLELAKDFYESIVSATVTPMLSLKEAEAVKVVENSFRNINIAFVNELAMSFSKLGIDVVDVIKGASTKPFAFMPHFPGCGIGGHCIPVDPYYLIDYAERSNGFTHKFLSLACKINEHMPNFTVKLAEKKLEEKGVKLKNAKVSVLGLSYKGNIDDCRESPAFDIIHELEEKGIKPKVFDPHVTTLSNVKNLDDALKGSDCVILATDHKEFKELNGPKLKKYGVKAIIDGRNFLDKESFVSSGIAFSGIGR